MLTVVSGGLQLDSAILLFSLSSTRRISAKIFMAGRTLPPSHSPMNGYDAMEDSLSGFELVDHRHAESDGDLVLPASSDNVSLFTSSSAPSVSHFDSGSEADLASPPCSPPRSPTLSASQFLFPDPVASFAGHLAGAHPAQLSTSQSTQRPAQPLYSECSLPASSSSQISTVRAASERRILSRDTITNHVSETAFALGSMPRGSFLDHRWTPVPSDALSHLQPESDALWARPAASASTVSPHQAYTFPPPSFSERTSSTVEPAWLSRTRRWISRPPSEFLPTDTQPSVSGSRADLRPKDPWVTDDVNSKEKVPVSTLRSHPTAKTWLLLLIVTLLVGFHSEPLLDYAKSTASVSASRLLNGLPYRSSCAASRTSNDVQIQQSVTSYPGLTELDVQSAVKQHIAQFALSIAAIPKKDIDTHGKEVSMDQGMQSVQNVRSAHVQSSALPQNTPIPVTPRIQSDQALTQDPKCVPNASRGKNQRYRDWISMLQNQVSQVEEALPVLPETSALIDAASVSWNFWLAELDRYMVGNLRPALLSARQQAAEAARLTSEYHDKTVQPALESLRAKAQDVARVTSDNLYEAARTTSKFAEEHVQPALQSLHQTARDAARATSESLYEAARTTSKYGEDSVQPALQSLHKTARDAAVSTSYKLNQAAAQFRAEVAETVQHLKKTSKIDLEAIGLDDYLGFTINTFNHVQDSPFVGNCREMASGASRSVEQRARQAGRLIRSSWLNSQDVFAHSQSDERKFATSSSFRF